MTSRQRRLATIVIALVAGAISPCACIGFAWELQTVTLTDALSSIDTFFWGILLIMSVHILPNALASIITLRHPEVVQPHQPVRRLLLLLLHSASTIILVCYVALNESIGLSSIGIRSLEPDVFFLLVMAGIGVFGFLTVAYGLGHRVMCRGKTEVDLSKPGKREFAAQKAIWERLALLPLLFLIVVGEELLFRGYLVLLLGDRTGMPLVCGLLSVAIWIVVHLYQGRSSIIYHALFGIATMGATLLTGNLVMSMTIHLCQLFLATFKTWIEADRQETEQKDAEEASSETVETIEPSQA